MVKKIAYFSIFASLIGASVISIGLGGFQLSVFRACVSLMLFFVVSEIISMHGKINFVCQKGNGYSIKFMLFWLVYSLITLMWVKDYQAWARSIYFLSLGVMCAIIYSRMFKSSKDILISFRIISIMVIIHNLIGWYEINTGNYIFLKNSQIVYARDRFPVSMFGNTNDFATFLLVSLFIVYICAVNSKKIFAKLIYFGAMTSSVYLLILTGSRANILGLILAGASFLYLLIQNKKKRRIIIIILITLFVVMLLILYFSRDFFTMVKRDLYFNFSEDTGSEKIRINLLKNGLDFLVDTCGFGTGSGNIEYWMANYGTRFTGKITSIHNWWMEILTGYGVIVFMLYLVFYYRLLKDLYSTYINSKDKTTIRISLGIICSMIGFIIGSVSSSSNISSEWLWVFWALVIAFQVNCCYYKTNEPTFSGKEDN